MAQKDSWETLFFKATNGDEQAFEGLCTAFPPLQEWIQRQSHDLGIPDDDVTSILENTVSAAVHWAQNHNNRPPNEEKGRQFWIRYFAMRTMAKWFSERQPRGPSPLESLKLDDPRELKRMDLCTTCFFWLQADERSILDWVQNHNMSVEEAGQEMGLSPDEAKDLYYRAFRNLRAHVDSADLPEDEYPDVADDEEDLFPPST